MASAQDNSQGQEQLRVARIAVSQLFIPVRQETAAPGCFPGPTPGPDPGCEPDPAEVLSSPMAVAIGPGEYAMGRVSIRLEPGIVGAGGWTPSHAPPMKVAKLSDGEDASSRWHAPPSITTSPGQPVATPGVIPSAVIKRSIPLTLVCEPQPVPSISTSPPASGGVYRGPAPTDLPERRGPQYLLDSEYRGGPEPRGRYAPASAHDMGYRLEFRGGTPAGRRAPASAHGGLQYPLDSEYRDGARRESQEPRGRRVSTSAQGLQYQYPTDGGYRVPTESLEPRDRRAPAPARTFTGYSRDRRYDVDARPGTVSPRKGSREYEDRRARDMRVIMPPPEQRAWSDTIRPGSRSPSRREALSPETSQYRRESTASERPKPRLDARPQYYPDRRGSLEYRQIPSYREERSREPTERMDRRESEESERSSVDRRESIGSVQRDSAEMLSERRESLRHGRKRSAESYQSERRGSLRRDSFHSQERDRLAPEWRESLEQEERISAEPKRSRRESLRSDKIESPEYQAPREPSEGRESTGSGRRESIRSGTSRSSSHRREGTQTDLREISDTDRLSVPSAGRDSIQPESERKSSIGSDRRGSVVSGAEKASIKSGRSGSIRSDRSPSAGRASQKSDRKDSVEADRSSQISAFRGSADAERASQLSDRRGSADAERASQLSDRRGSADAERASQLSDRRGSADAERASQLSDRRGSADGDRPSQQSDRRGSVQSERVSLRSDWTASAPSERANLRSDPCALSQRASQQTSQSERSSQQSDKRGSIQSQNASQQSDRRGSDPSERSSQKSSQRGSVQSEKASQKSEKKESSEQRKLSQLSDRKGSVKSEGRESAEAERVSLESGGRESLRSAQRGSGEQERISIRSDQRGSAEQERTSVRSEQRGSAEQDRTSIRSEQRGSGEKERTSIRSEQRESAEQERTSIRSEQRGSAEQERTSIRSEQRGSAEQERTSIRSEQRGSAEQERTSIRSEQRGSAEQERASARSEQRGSAEQERTSVRSEQRRSAEQERTSTQSGRTESLLSEIAEDVEIESYAGTSSTQSSRRPSLRSEEKDREELEDTHEPSDRVESRRGTFDKRESLRRESAALENGEVLSEGERISTSTERKRSMTSSERRSSLRASRASEDSKRRSTASAWRDSEDMETSTKFTCIDCMRILELIAVSLFAALLLALLPELNWEGSDSDNPVKRYGNESSRDEKEGKLLEDKGVQVPVDAFPPRHEDVQVPDDHLSRKNEVVQVPDDAFQQKNEGVQVPENGLSKNKGVQVPEDLISKQTEGAVTAQHSDLRPVNEQDKVSTIPFVTYLAPLATTHSAHERSKKTNSLSTAVYTRPAFTIPEARSRENLATLTPRPPPTWPKEETRSLAPKFTRPSVKSPKESSRRNSPSLATRRGPSQPKVSKRTKLPGSLANRNTFLKTSTRPSTPSSEKHLISARTTVNIPDDEATHITKTDTKISKFETVSKELSSTKSTYADQEGSSNKISKIETRSTTIMYWSIPSRKTGGTFYSRSVSRAKTPANRFSTAKTLFRERDTLPTAYSRNRLTPILYSRFPVTDSRVQRRTDTTITALQQSLKHQTTTTKLATKNIDHFSEGRSSASSVYTTGNSFPSSTFEKDVSETTSSRNPTNSIRASDNNISSFRPLSAPTPAKRTSVAAQTRRKGTATPSLRRASQEQSARVSHVPLLPAKPTRRTQELLTRRLVRPTPRQRSKQTALVLLSRSAPAQTTILSVNSRESHIPLSTQLVTTQGSITMSSQEKKPDITTNIHHKDSASTDIHSTVSSHINHGRPNGEQDEYKVTRPFLVTEQNLGNDVTKYLATDGSGDAVNSLRVENATASLTPVPTIAKRPTTSDALLERPDLQEESAGLTRLTELLITRHSSIPQASTRDIQVDLDMKPSQRPETSPSFQPRVTEKGVSGRYRPTVITPKVRPSVIPTTRNRKPKTGVTEKRRTGKRNPRRPTTRYPTLTPSRRNITATIIERHDWPTKMLPEKPRQISSAERWSTFIVTAASRVFQPRLTARLHTSKIPEKGGRTPQTSSLPGRLPVENPTPHEKIVSAAERLPERLPPGDPIPHQREIVTATAAERPTISLSRLPDNARPPTIHFATPQMAEEHRPTPRFTASPQTHISQGRPLESHSISPKKTPLTDTRALANFSTVPSIPRHKSMNPAVESRTAEKAQATTTPTQVYRTEPPSTLHHSQAPPTREQLQTSLREGAVTPDPTAPPRIPTEQTSLSERAVTPGPTVPPRIPTEQTTLNERAVTSAPTAPTRIPTEQTTLSKRAVTPGPTAPPRIPTEQTSLSERAATPGPTVPPRIPTEQTTLNEKAVTSAPTAPTRILTEQTTLSERAVTPAPTAPLRIPTELTSLSERAVTPDPTAPPRIPTEQTSLSERAVTPAPIASPRIPTEQTLDERTRVAPSPTQQHRGTSQLLTTRVPTAVEPALRVTSLNRTIASRRETTGEKADQTSGKTFPMRTHDFLPSRDPKPTLVLMPSRNPTSSRDPMPTNGLIPTRDLMVPIPTRDLIPTRDPIGSIPTRDLIPSRNPMGPIPTRDLIPTRNPMDPIPTRDIIPTRNPMGPIPTRNLIPTRNPMDPIPTRDLLPTRNPMGPIPTRDLIPSRDPMGSIPKRDLIPTRDPIGSIPSRDLIPTRDPKGPIPTRDLMPRSNRTPYNTTNFGREGEIIGEPAPASREVHPAEEMSSIESQRPFTGYRSQRPRVRNATQLAPRGGLFPEQPEHRDGSTPDWHPARETRDAVSRPTPALPGALIETERVSEKASVAPQGRERDTTLHPRVTLSIHAHRNESYPSEQPMS